MTKKDGIIVGVTLVVLAMVIYSITSFVAKKKEGVSNRPPLSVTKENEGKENQKVQSNQNNNINNNNISNNSGDISSVNKSENQQEVATQSLGSQVLDIAESSLGSPSKVLNEVMVVSRKKVQLIDTSVGGIEGKQLVNCLELLDGSNKVLNLYVNGVVYDSLLVGDRLNIKYNLYINANGVEMPLVVEATKVGV